jgi:hypothetical protein
MDSRRNGAAGLGLAALLVASPAPAQLVSSEEAQARRQCIGEAGRRGWQVEEVVGFRAAGGGRYEVSLRASQRGTSRELACAWDGWRATVSEAVAPGRPPGSVASPSSSAALCEQALRDRVEADARRRGFRSGDVRLQPGRTFPTTSGEEGLLGEGDFRFGDRGFERMTWQCRVNALSGTVAGTRYVPHAGGTTRRLTCESRDGQPRTCTARVAGQVRLTRRASSARCDEGRTWWWTLDGITVTQGCRAEFEYREQGREP